MQTPEKSPKLPQPAEKTVFIESSKQDVITLLD
jgi:hypothetical protein